MHMQRRMYHRLDGYEELKPLLEGSDGEILAGFHGLPALIRIPAASTVDRPKARLVSCLLLGNEPSGFLALVDLLRQGERFPFDLWVLIGNVRAATEEGLYAHRHLDDQEDFNRVWGLDPASASTTEQRQSAAAILDELRMAGLEAAVDIHNNSGRNPYYSILTQQSPEGQRLASLCADIAVLWRLGAHTLMEALALICPAVSVECGPPHMRKGTEFATRVIHRFLTVGGFTRPADADTDRPQGHRTIELLQRVTVRPEVAFSFGETEATDGETDFVIAPDLDRYNFQMLPAEHTIGLVHPEAAMPLVATDMDGRDVTDNLFRITPDRRVVVVDDVMPIMMTTTVTQTRRDCLFYTAGTVA